MPLFFGSKIATLGRTSTGMAGYQFFVVTKLFILIGVLKMKRFFAFLRSNLVLRPPSQSNAIKVPCRSQLEYNSLRNIHVCS